MVHLEGGEPVFVGEVAHIVGAVQSGPRGDEEIDDRDAFGDLLLLCGRHHKVIDGPRTQDRYPVAVLREWKRERESEFDAAGRAKLEALDDLPAQLPGLLVDAFRDVTAELEAALKRLEDAGQLTHETGQLLHVALARTSTSGPAVGDGAVGIKEDFEAAYDAAGGASFLGLPSADAYRIGPGVVQHLRGAHCGHPAVICALNGRPAVVITADLWNGIAGVGDSAMDVVDEDVQPTEARDHVVDEQRRDVRVGLVDLERGRLHSLGEHLVDNDLSLRRRADIGERDIGSLLGQQPDSRRSPAPGASGDQRNFACERLVHSSP
jgi:hypothetical protein